MTGFEGVVPALGQALSKRGYTALTPVQTAVLVPELRGTDALVSAQTGSGKTVAFGLALATDLLDGADRFIRTQSPLALIVAPTRELALQVKRELDWLYELTGASIVSCVGGMDGRTERRNLERGAHIVVGTPGRLCDHIDRHAFDTSRLKAIVLDEADEMLDLGFREDLEHILNAAPADRRTMMFSATVPRAIAALAKRYQRNAVRVVTAEESSQHLDIEYRALTVAPKDEENGIINVLRYFDAKNALVFCATRAAVNHMTSRFANRGFSVVALSGELSQAERSHALQAMRDGRARVCIATDVAARGIDLPNLELVIHADLPKNSESLLHRSGRTGRAGRKGVSVLIVPYKARKRTERLLRESGIEATWAQPPSAEEVMRKDDERILTDPALSEPLSEEEQVFARELLSHHDAEQIAAAFVRLYRAGQSAPEELVDTAPLERTTVQTDNFENGTWISLSVGRKDNAEPRWLLAMLCRVGNLTNRDIGAIRIHQHATHVELSPACVEKFFDAIGPDNTIEKSTTVTRLDGKPAMTTDGPRGSRDKPYAKKKPFGARKTGAQGRLTQKSRRFDKPDATTGGTETGDKRKKPDRDDPARDRKKPSRDGKPWAKKAGDTRTGRKKPADDQARDKKRKVVDRPPAEPAKPRETLSFKPGARSTTPAKPGSAPLMRKRPKKNSD